MNNTNHAQLLLKLSLGIILLSHGLLKIFVFTIPGTVGFLKVSACLQLLHI
jgi:putative oxidoreductase